MGDAVSQTVARPPTTSSLQKSRTQIIWLSSFLSGLLLTCARDRFGRTSTTRPSTNWITYPHASRHFDDIIRTPYRPVDVNEGERHRANPAPRRDRLALAL